MNYELYKSLKSHGVLLWLLVGILKCRAGGKLF